MSKPAKLLTLYVRDPITRKFVSIEGAVAQGVIDNGVYKVTGIVSETPGELRSIKASKKNKGLL